ncbi:hypothetical protein BOS5A_211427 [Bosea sp. EC-HK365B]|nr:hypothetical protein BOSE21B_50264 [Bosea sp. 21B]VVT60636.1 hypothetical protein BOS5A_211427 [Bosea sp. EC-HK365B]VXB68957.1 hypothetical protein BOSE127_140366 [Bosea sp. 127]
MILIRQENIVLQDGFFTCVRVRTREWRI